MDPFPVCGGRRTALAAAAAADRKTKKFVSPSSIGFN
jgi:hypothetical protein